MKRIRGIDDARAAPPRSFDSHVTVTEHEKGIILNVNGSPALLDKEQAVHIAHCLLEAAEYFILNEAKSDEHQA